MPMVLICLRRIREKETAEGKKKGNEKEEIDARKKGSIAKTKEEKRKRKRG